ncbi:MAG TPA: metal-dependent hydrolase [Thermoanaerobaculia bacterium]
MPTIFTHPAVPLGLSPWFRRLPRSLIVVAAIASAIPDIDVLSFRFGIPYESPLGHRGFTHSLPFAFTLALLLALPFRSCFARAFAYLFLAIASHGLVDAMTNGGKGVGFFIPFSTKRYFLPWRPIRVSPIGATHFAAKAGVVLRSELMWVWLPFAVVAALGLLLRSRRAISTE